MIMRDVIISITGVQQTPGGPNALELVTPGKYGQEKDEICLTYQETELCGIAGTTTTFSVSPRRVELKREGTLNAEMIFEEGEKRYFLYETPLGSVTMGLNTNRIKCQLNRHGGYMEIDYTIDANQSVVGRNRFHIFVEEPKESHIGDIRWPI